MSGVFFVHIMKTGGVTLTNALRQHFGSDAVCPPPDDHGLAMKASPHKLLELSAPQRQRYRAYSVHMPAWSARVVAPGFHTVTILRDPIERTISHLHQIARIDWAPDDIEAIWDEVDWRCRLADYQTRFFAEELPQEVPEEHQAAVRASLPTAFTEARAGGGPGLLGTFYTTAVSNPAPLDPEALERAERCLRSFDVVGVTEGLERAARRLADLLGMGPPGLGRDNVTRDRPPVPASFRRRLEADLTMDLELYETARSLDRRSIDT